MLRIAGLAKSYGPVQALSDVHLLVARGEVVGLLGANGAGKTTLISIVAGLLRPDRGDVEISGIDALRRPKDVRRLIGFAPQDLSVYPSVTVRRNLEFFGELGGLSNPVLRARVEEVGAALGLSGLFGRLARTLSSGEKRRLHTAIALLLHPPLLLLDEPTVGADVQTRASILEYVRQLAASGSAVCYCTHYLPEVEALGASVAILERGRIISRGTLKELVAMHGTSAVHLSFNGPVPAIGSEFAAVTDGSCVRISTPQPAATAARVLAELAGGASRLHAVEILKPDLDSVYWTLTGKRYGSVNGGGHDDVPLAATHSDARAPGV